MGYTHIKKRINPVSNSLTKQKVFKNREPTDSAISVQNNPETQSFSILLNSKSRCPPYQILLLKHFHKLYVYMYQYRQIKELFYKRAPINSCMPQCPKISRRCNHR